MDSWRDKWLRGYQLKEIIGAGGFSVVYMAHQPTIEREVAIKAILPSYANDTEFIRRFEKEAQFIARLEHLHIVPLYDFWRDPEGAYLVMRMFKGGSIKSLLEQKGALPLSEAIKLVNQIASALSVAHTNGVVHQDLKPENILLDELGNAYLVDFGIAKDVVRNINLSDGGKDKIWGTPAFMAPEQITEMKASPQTDIYSLGLIIYTLLTGELPYRAADLTTIIRQKLYEFLPPVSLNRTDLLDGINMLIWQATDVRPENRHSNVLQLAEEFQSYRTDSALPDLNLDAAALIMGGSTTLPLSTTHILPGIVQNPYKGLRAFEEADAVDFFGRDTLVAKLLEQMSHSSRFLAVIGSSGSGKSSVVKAGLIPKIRQGALPNSTWWFVTTMSPGASPLIELEQALMRVALETPVIPIVEQVRNSDTALRELLPTILPPNGELLLMVNQFEELFALTEDENERKRFLSNLVEAVTHPESQLRVIITLRADFYDRPLNYHDFGQLIRDNSEVVLPLSPAELENAIEAPAKRVGLTVDRDLLATIVNDVQGQPGMLPLLQFALTELFEYREGTQLTLDGYKAIGGVSGALAKRANELYKQLNETQQTAAQQIFMRLVAPGEGAADTRRRVLRSELTSMGSDKQMLQDLLDMFGKYRLLTFDRDPVTRAPTVEIAHEALIHGWQLLREWLEANRDRLYVHRRLSEAAAEWAQSDQDSGFLAVGSRLTQFEDLKLPLNEQEQAYLQASIANRQRSIRRARFFTTALAVTAVGAVIMAILAFIGQDRATRAQASAETERDRANEQAQIARSRELAVSALTEGDRQDRALLMSLEALHHYDTVEARRSLLLSLVENAHLDAFLVGHTDIVRSVAVSPDGKIVATAGDDRTIRLWDAETHQPIGDPLTGHEAVIWKIAFSPDGQKIVSAGHDRTVRIWEIANPENELVLEGHTDNIWDVAFSPDGRWVASASSDTTVILWDLTQAPPAPQVLDWHTDEVFAVAFSLDGKFLASGGADLNLILWDMENDLETTVLTGHENWILTLAFSPDGRALASSGPENQVLFWTVEDRRFFGSFATNHTDWVRDIAFSPDGTRLITASADNSMRVWDTETALLAQPPIIGHVDAVWDVAFLPDGNQFVTASSDRSAIVWRLEARQPLATPVPTSDESPVWSVAFSGCQLAAANGSVTAAGDFNIQVWENPCIEMGEPALLAGHFALVSSVNFSPDGQFLVSGSADRSVMVWKAGENVASLQMHPASVTGVAFHPDGNHLASVDGDGTLIFWQKAGDDTWDVESERHSLGGLTSVTYSPDGALLAVATQAGQVLLFDSQRHEQITSPLEGHTDDVEVVTFSPDGKHLASGSRDGTIILWSLATLKPMGQPLSGHTNWVTALAFSPDGKMLVSGSRDTTLLFWDLTVRQPFSPPLIAHTDWVTDLAFTTDGQILASGGRDGKVFLWKANLAAWIGVACEIANHSFSQAEWERLFQEEAYRATCGE